MKPQVLTPKVFRDERGFFFESFRQNQFDIPFVQDNISFSLYGTIRALHYQAKPGQMKLVSCLLGTIWDVAVDIRPDSPTFGQWMAVELNDREKKQFLIPPDFAHGYCVLSKEALVHYKVSAYYDPVEEKSIRWNDPDLNIAWPIKEPLLSERDQKAPLLKEVLYAVDSRR